MYVRVPCEDGTVHKCFSRTFPFFLSPCERCLVPHRPSIMNRLSPAFSILKHEETKQHAACRRKESESRSRTCPTTTTDLKQGGVNIINIQEGYSYYRK